MSKLGEIKISIPTFSDKLPSNNKKVKITPFRVADEKTLLIASQSQNSIEMLNALKSIVSNCSDYPIEKMTSYDIEYLFLKIRAKSVGETADIGVACTQCEEYNKITVDLEAVVVDKPDNHTNIIKIADNLVFEMKEADLEEAAKIDFSDPDDLLRLISMSISKIYYDEDIIEVDYTDYDDLKKLIEDMTADQFELFQEYFRTSPKLSKPIDFVCGSCGHENKQVLEGLSSFF